MHQNRSVVDDQQVILAAEITNAAPDFGQLAPMFEATLRELSEQGMTETPEVVLADAGYWHHPQMQAISERGIEVLVPPDRRQPFGDLTRILMSVARFSFTLRLTAVRAIGPMGSPTRPSSARASSLTTVPRLAGVNLMS